ncbi:MAG: segregation/condensation protein A [Nanoarchaeota archaeon]|nr:segregation/condensation protein A [Nanoarchaeota archaeon]
MSSDPNIQEIGPENRLYELATDRNARDWKSFLYDLIHKEGLDPWDIDLKILTKKYLELIKTSMTLVDFNISGKLLTIAVFLLKTKAELLVERDLRGIEEKINSVQSSNQEDFIDNVEALQDFDNELDILSQEKKEKYSLKLRNPLARKRKVNIFDLIKTLEKTFEQSNRRQANFFIRHAEIKYSGPTYEKKKKDLKVIINELYSLIINELENRGSQLTFDHITEGIEYKEGILEKFIPLLHLHNQNKLTVSQKVHFGIINIDKIDEE